MSEIDPVVLQLRAELDQYLTTLRSSTRTVDQQLGLQEKRVKKLEGEMRRSSGQIAGHLKGLAGALAGAFSVQQVAALSDSWTRFTNQLKVTGIEGDELVAVQNRLIAVANRNGVAIESLGSLYSSLALSASESGASQMEMEAATRSVAAALRVQGTSGEQAQGSLLQLSQAIGSSRIEMEEFGSLIDGMPALLREVAKHVDGAAGSVNKLKQLIKDQKGPGVSGAQLFEALVASMKNLETQASNTQLTLSNSLTVLVNEFTKYIGTSSITKTATEAVSGAMLLLSENLDTVIEALSVIALFMGARFVGSMAAGTIATIAASNAMFALQARALGAATTMEALSFAMGGFAAAIPGIALAALVAGIGYYILTAESAEEQTKRFADAAAEAGTEADRMEQRLRDAGVALAGVGDAAEAAGSDLHGFWGEIAGTINRLNDLAHSAAVARLALIGTRLQEIDAEKRGIRTQQLMRAGFATGGQVPVTVDSPLLGNTRGDTASLAALDAEKAALQRQINAIGAGAAAGVNVLEDAPGASSAAAAGKPGKPKKDTGPSEAEITQRFNDEMDGYRSRMASAQAQIARSAEERAVLELEQVDIAERSTLRAIEADANYNAADKARLTAAVEMVAVLEREAIEFQKRADLERDAAEIADEQFRARADALSLQYDLAETEAERKRLALEIVDAETEYLRSKLQAVIDSKTAGEAEQKRAQIALQSLNAMAAGRREAVSRSNETEVERYLRDLRKSPEQINEALDGIRIDGLEAINDELTDAIMGAKSLGDAFEAVADQIIADLIRIAIQQAVIRPMAESLFGGSGGGGGGGGLFGSIMSALGMAAGVGKTAGTFGGLKGFATGGSMMIGGRGGADNNVLSMNGSPFARVSRGERLDIVPNERLAGGASRSGGIVRVMIEEAPGFAARVRTEAVGVAVEVVKVSQPALTQAAVNETFRQAGRPSL